MSAQLLKYCTETAQEIVPNYCKDKMDAAGLAVKLSQFFEGIAVTNELLAAKGSQAAVTQYVLQQVEEVSHAGGAVG